MEIVELMKQGNINVTISMNDLKDFFNELVTKIVPEPKNEEKYLTRTEASEMLKVDKSTLWRWQKENYLLPIHIGGKIVYKMSDINGLLNG
jgi:predicted DNA-binding transcriptional regulator AlpA